MSRENIQHQVIFTTKDSRKNLVEEIRTFSTSTQACTFFQSIRHKSATKPIIIVKEK